MKKKEFIRVALPKRNKFNPKARKAERKAASITYKIQNSRLPVSVKEQVYNCIKKHEEANLFVPFHVCDEHHKAVVHMGKKAVPHLFNALLEVEHSANFVIAVIPVILNESVPGYKPTFPHRPKMLRDMFIVWGKDLGHIK